MFYELAFLLSEEVIDSYENHHADESIPIDFISYFELAYIGPKRKDVADEKSPCIQLIFGMFTVT